MRTLAEFLNTLKTQPQSIQFQHTMDVIAAHYRYHPTDFSNGNTHNEAGTNEGSCKLFAFAKLNQLTPEQTLACFGDYYRVDVLKNPQGTDHANIRNFMQTGWQGIHFKGQALQAV